MLHTLDRASSGAPIHAPMGDVDLQTWFAELTSDEFVAFSPEHHGAIHARLPDGYPVFVASETIGESFMTHHYVIEIARPDHIRAVSAASALWLPNGEVAPMRTTWELTVEPHGEHACRLVSDVLAESSHELLVALTAQRPPDAPNNVQLHCAAETQRIAADIERKLKRV